MAEFVTAFETTEGIKKYDFQSLGNFPACQVGQTLKVTAVDANGQPTAWEAVKVASLGEDGLVPSEQLPETESSSTVYTGTIGTSWTEDEATGVKTQTVAIAGITAGDNARLDHDTTSIDGTSAGYAKFVEEDNQFLALITNGFAQTVAGGVKFTIFGDANTVAIPIWVEV